MHCRTCDYSLWTIRPGPCPECGTPFRPSEFRFRPNAVLFRCPHCPQTYYGTSGDGHLQPLNFTCVACGQHVVMDEMAVTPAPGVAEVDTGSPPLAWIERAKIGIPRAWFRTVRSTLGAPGDAMRSIPATAPLSDPIFFAAISSALTSIVVLGVAVLGIAIGSAVAANTGGALALAMFTQVGLVVANVLFAVIATLLGGVAGHAALVVVRGARCGLARSMQASLYASGAAYALYIIPCPCFFFIGFVWWAICLGAMYRVAHTAPTWKAVVAAIAAMLFATVASLALAALPQSIGVKNSWVQFNTTSTTSAGGITSGATSDAIVDRAPKTEPDADIDRDPAPEVGDVPSPPASGGN